MTTSVDDLTSANWTIRRPVAFILLGFLGACIVYLLAFATDDELRRSMVIPIVGNFGLIAAAYLGLPSLDLRGILLSNRPQVVTAPMMYPGPAYQTQPFVDPANPAADRPA